MIASICLVLASFAPQDTALAEAARARVEGRWGEAWQWLQKAEAGRPRARERAALLHAAGDLGGALQAAEEGIERSGNDLELRWRAATVAVTLGDGPRASAHAAGLSEAIEESELPAEELESWAESARTLAREARGLLAAEEARASAVGLARFTAIALLSGALGLFFLALFRR